MLKKLGPISTLFILTALCFATGAHGGPLKTRNVFLIISDGFRWQEVFNGAEADLMTKENGVRNPQALTNQYWRDTPDARRAALLPFIWSEIGRHGQILGNEDKGSVVTVSNGRKFSYPGYNEILTGFGDPQINSNDKIPNQNETVFEWLNERPRLRGRVAVFGTWDVFPYIFNLERSHLPIWPAWESRFSGFEIRVPDFVTEIRRDTTAIWDDLTYDSFLFDAAVGYVKKDRPHLAFIGFGETDEWAHAGRYDLYLNAAHHVDEFVRQLWNTVQSMSEYRGKTTFILTADHGRGAGPKGWRDHGEKIDGAEGDWIAIIGPDTPAAGERAGTEPLTESQIAATIAVLLGEDFHSAFPRSGPPISILTVSRPNR